MDLMIKPIFKIAPSQMAIMRLNINREICLFLNVEKIQHRE